MEKEGERGGVGEGEGEGEVVEMRVLVVDDSPVDRRMVEGLIKRSGRGMFQVITVDSGKKAMEVLGLNNGRTDSIAASEQKIDVILTDYCMPEMSGFDLLKAVRERSSPKPIPVVIMSSENEPQRINRCRAVGAADFILKPLQSKDVQRLRDSVTSTPLAPKNASSKRKMPMDVMAEKSGSERRPRLAGVAVA